MKFKLDENFGSRTQRLFRDTGHDVATVYEQALQGSTDQRVYDVCCREHRCLVTLDLDFADILRFPPSESAGIIVVRVSPNSSLSFLEHLIQQFLSALEQIPFSNDLWIVEAGRIRIHQRRSDLDE